MDKKFKNIIDEIKALDRNEKFLFNVCKIINEKLPYYNWVGFYFISKDDSNMLELGPFVGEPTEHVKIPVGRGICGQAVALNKPIIVDDVNAEDNYLACSLKVKSEIVVPIYKDGEIIGEIDIDSHEAAAFDDEDRKFLEEVCNIVASVL